MSYIATGPADSTPGFPLALPLLAVLVLVFASLRVRLLLQLPAGFSERLWIGSGGGAVMGRDKGMDMDNGGRNAFGLLFGEGATDEALVTIEAEAVRASSAAGGRVLR